VRVRVRDRDGESEKEREVEREGKKELGNIQHAMLMLCSSAVALTPIFVRAVDVVAHF
jgi:hypothetical protein